MESLESHDFPPNIPILSPKFCIVSPLYPHYTLFFVPLDWFKGKSKPETMNSISKYRVFLYFILKPNHEISPMGDSFFILLFLKWHTPPLTNSACK